MKKVAIIGGGAAGMMAGIVLADKGYSPTIYEKNDRLGKKLFITGKGRCNVTNCCDTEELLKNVVTNSKFLYSSFYNFDAYSAMDFFEKLGVRLKVERGNRVFPISDHSSDIIVALEKGLRDRKVDIKLSTEVTDIVTEKITFDEGIYEEKKQNKKNAKVIGIRICDKNNQKKLIEYDKVIICTGGVSYPLTGSTGDGIRWADDMGLKIEKPRPALSPILIKETLCSDLMGLSLKNIKVNFTTKINNKEKIIYEDFGEMLFTHFGVSGPVILSASSYIGKYIEQSIKLCIDLKPALSIEQLDSRILRDFSESMNKQFRNSLGELLPKSMIPIIIKLSGINEYKRVNEITREERLTLVRLLKKFELTVKGLSGFNDAIITHGGVSVKEINPNDMSAKKIEGLSFAGEVIDVDAVTGGFNLQIAWSTAAALE